MWNSGSTSSDLAKGKKFLKKLLYVQHVNKEKDMASEIPDRYIQECLIFHRTHFHTEYLKRPKENLSILKSSMADSIDIWRGVAVYSNPLPTLLQLKDVTIHAFVVFQTKSSSGYMWWSLEKNGHHIVLQHSPNKDDVINKIYNTEKKTTVERLGPIKKQKRDLAHFNGHVSELMQIIVDTNKLNEPYHLIFSNCQNFASFVFEKLSRKNKWSTVTSAIVDRIGFKKDWIKKIEPENKVDAFKYKSILNDEKFDCYWAMMEGRRKDFEKLIKEMTIESLNGVDSQGYTLLEWATVFSSSDWPIEEKLKKKGAKIRSDGELFKQNLFFIALQYLPPNQKSKYLSFDGIELNGANEAGDTALHLALYGEKWEIAEEILRKFKNFDVNSTNVLRDTPLHLAAKHKNCEIGLFKKILHRTNSENINKVDGNGRTALHYAIDNQCENKVKELLKRDDVDVNIKNYFNNSTALHLASSWEVIRTADLFNLFMGKSTDLNFAQDEEETALRVARSTMSMNFSDLLKLILEKSKEINAQDKDGNTPLHLAIRTKSETATKQLLAHKDVNVNIKNNRNETALHLASQWPNIPADLFKIILEKSTSDIINTQDEIGYTTLHYAIIKKSEIAVKELLAHKDVNVKNKSNETVLQFATRTWKNIPVDLFNLILQKSTYVINAQDNRGDTALHYAIFQKSKIATKELLAHNDVNVNVQNNDHETALHYASMWTNIPSDLFKLILEKTTDVNAQDKDGRTALHLAISNQSEVATKELLAHSDVDEQFRTLTKVKELLAHKDVDDKVKNNKNETALHFASQWPDIPLDLFQIILEKSNDVNAQDDDGWTALHFAISNQSEVATKELLHHNDVDVNIKNNNNCTPLHFASNYWRDIPSDLFNLILEKSTNVNAQDKDGWTAFHLTIIHNSEIATRKLLAHKDVNVNVKDKNNRTALHLANSTPLHCLCWTNIPVDLFKLILDKSTDVINAQDNDGNTPLHLAILHKYEIATKELLARSDVNVNIKNNRNETTLHLASQRPNIPADLFKIILQKSTDVINAQDNDGNTALHRAILFESEIATKELLAHKDVNVNIKNNDHETALSYASEWEDIPMDLFNLISERKANKVKKF